MLKRLLTGLLVILASQLILKNTYASSSFPTAALQVGVTGITCTTCHTIMAGGSNAIKPDTCTTAFRSNRDYKALKTCLTAETPSAKACALPLVSNGKACVAAPKLGTGITTVGNTTGKAAFDSYTINCGVGTLFLSAAIQDMPKVYTPRLSIEIIKTGKTKPQYDLIDGDKFYSKDAKLANGPGIYNVLVKKTIATGPAVNKTAEKYNAVYACQNVNKVKTPNTKPVVVNNN